MHSKYHTIALLASLVVLYKVYVWVKITAYDKYSFYGAESK